MKFSIDGTRLDIELNYLKALTDKEGFKRLIRIANSQIITEEDKDFFRPFLKGVAQALEEYIILGFDKAATSYSKKKIV